MERVEDLIGGATIQLQRCLAAKTARDYARMKDFRKKGSVSVAVARWH